MFVKLTQNSSLLKSSSPSSVTIVNVVVDKILKIFLKNHFRIYKHVIKSLFKIVESINLLNAYRIAQRNKKKVI